MRLLRRLGTYCIAAMLASALAGVASPPPAITPSDLISPAQLNSQLADVKSGEIILIHVGFHKLYQMGHIPGSQYAGPAARPDGLEALQKLVAKLPRNHKIVIYCGCCPWDDCPNVRPAFAALKEKGFTNLKVLDIPDRLGSDWGAKGYPLIQGD